MGEHRKRCDHNRCDALATRTVSDKNGTLMLCPKHFKKFVTEFTEVLEEAREYDKEN